VKVAQRNQDKSIKKPIKIKLKSDGCPSVPKITKKEGYGTKNVQGMLRRYVLAHIRMYQSDNLYQSYKCMLGFISGKPKVTIPWGRLCEDPSLWIRPECFPTDFPWGDPSKIRVGDVFRLLEHWEQRREQHLKPLIWASTCPILADVDRSSSSEHTSGQSSTDDSDRSDSNSNSLDGQWSSIQNSKSSSDTGRSATPQHQHSSDIGEASSKGRDDDDLHMASPPRQENEVEYEDFSMRILLHNSFYLLGFLFSISDGC
jgi:hypothetical protein